MRIVSGRYGPRQKNRLAKARRYAGSETDLPDFSIIRDITNSCRNSLCSCLISFSIEILLLFSHNLFEKAGETVW